MKPFLPLALLLTVLAGCARIAASPPMLGAPQTKVAVGDQLFLVHHTHRRAEATRLSRDPAPKTLSNIARAAEAIRAATGCELRKGTLYGDAVMAEALLDCPGARPTRVLPQYRFDEIGAR